MTLASNTLPTAENQAYYLSPTDEDSVCWRCGEPDSAHSWYGGRTYCESAWSEDLADNVFDNTKTFEPNPPVMDDEELVRRMAFIQDTRDWML